MVVWVHEMRDFLAFLESEYGEVLVQRWEECRKRARDERASLEVS